MPQIPDITASYANRDNIGGVSIANPEVRDVRYAAKAQKYEKISNILEKVGSEYQQKWERKQAVERQLVASQEQMNASIAGDKLIQDAQNLPDDQVMPFITKGMEKINADAYKKYGGDQEMWGQVSLNIQRSALETQHNAFNFVQKRAKDTALAGFVEQEMYLKSKALNSKDPNIELAQLDASLDSLTKAGYMSKEAAAKASVDARGDITVARISRMINSNNLTAAAQTLRANSTMLPLNAQIQLENNIKSTSDALQNRAIANQNKIVAQQLKIQEMEYTDPAGAAVLKGVKPDDTKAIYIATDRRSILTQPEVKHYKARLDAAKSSEEFINTYNAIYDAKVGKYSNDDPIKLDLHQKFTEEMRDNVSPSAYTMMELNANGAKEQMQTLFESRKIKDEDLNAVAKKADIMPVIESKASLYGNWLSKTRTPDDVVAYKKTISRIARTRMMQTGEDVDEAVKFAITGTGDTFNSFRLYGSEVIVPKDAPEIHLKKGLEDFVKQSLGVDSAAVELRLDKNNTGYYLFDPSDNTRLKDKGNKPYYITVDEAAKKGAEYYAPKKYIHPDNGRVGK